MKKLFLLFLSFLPGMAMAEWQTGPSAISGGNQYWLYGNMYGNNLDAYVAPDAGMAWQDVLNLMVSGGQELASSVYLPGGGLGNVPGVGTYFFFTTNQLGGDLYVYPDPTPPYYYYIAGGAAYSNQWLAATLRIHGVGPNGATVVAGATNVFSLYQFNDQSGSGLSWGDFDNITFAWSNYQAQAVAVKLEVMAPGTIDNCWFNWLGAISPSNYNQSWSSGGPAGAYNLDDANSGSNVCIIPLICGGGSGAITLSHDWFVNCACGPILNQEHVQINNCEDYGFGYFNGCQTNGWPSNSIAIVDNYGHVPIRQCDIALGPGLIASGGDIEVNHYHMIGGPAGIEIKTTWPQEYGIVKIHDCQFEAITGAKDIILAQDTNNWQQGGPGVAVSLEDMSDYTTQDGDVRVYQMNPTNFILSTNINGVAGFGQNWAIDRGVYEDTVAGHPVYMIKTNNIVEWPTL